MKRTRTPAALLMATLIGLALWLGQDGLAAWLLWRRDFSRLERVSAERYFLPAVRAYDQDRAGGSNSPPDSLRGWATRRFESRFPGEAVTDLATFPTGELALLLCSRERWKEGARVRLVVLDADRASVITASSGPLQVNAYEFKLGTLGSSVAVLVVGQGSGEYGLLLKRETCGFVVIPCEGRETAPHFTCWTGLRLQDVDGDGIPEVRGLKGKGARCPGCGQEGEANEVTWKLEGASFRPWTIRGEECGLVCERRWSPQVGSPSEF